MSNHWDFYFATVNEQVASIMVDLGIRSHVPDAQKSLLTWVWVEMHRARPDGLAEPEEVPRLQELEDDLVATVRASAALVGRVTTAGRREFYFYGEPGNASEQQVAAAMARYPDYKYTCESQADEAWEQYLDVLYPPPLDMEAIRNRKTRMALQEKGDDPAEIRVVTHWVVIPDAARTQFLREADARGFAPAQGAAAENPCQIALERENSMEEIDQTTLVLRELAAAHGGSYDGWETPVVGTGMGLE